MATGNQQQKHLSLSFPTIREFIPSLEELIKIKVIFILGQEMFRLQNLKNSVPFSTHNEETFRTENSYK